MIKKRRIFLVAGILSLLFLSSCSRKIIGATPHRRDRNCGCEHLCPLDSSSIYLLSYTTP